MKMQKMNLYEIVSKLTGDIEPTGDNSIDLDRLDNLEIYLDLCDSMLTDIQSIANQYKDSTAASEQNIGERAEDFIKSIIDYFNE